MFSKIIIIIVECPVKIRKTHGSNFQKINRKILNCTKKNKQKKVKKNNTKNRLKIINLHDYIPEIIFILIRILGINPFIPCFAIMRILFKNFRNDFLIFIK